MPPPAGRPLASAKDPNGLTIQQAADRIGVHYQSIRNWIRDEQLPVTRFGPTGGILRVHVDDLLEVAGGR